MKNKLKSAFTKTKKSRVGLILTIVALVEILAIMVVSTSAWIESISSIKVYTTGQSEPGGTKGVVASKLKQRLGLAVGNTTDIDLTQYFRPSGGYHLSGASSVDGNVMYFPETKGNTTQKYRVGTINDKNVNYISFTVKTTTGNVALAFDSTPTIKFGGTELTGDQLKLVRFSVGNGSTFKVFSLASEFEDTVISGENATDTASSTVRSFSDYAVGNTNLVTTTTANGYLTFNMWIQDPTGASSDVYNNKALTVENLKLVTVKPFTLRSTYMNDNGSYVAGATGGTVAINDGEFGETAVAYLKSGSVVTLKASPNTTNGYSFVGWSKTANGSVIDNMGVGNCTNNIYSIMYTFNTADFSGDYELYAQFNDRHILYLDPKYKHYSGNNGTTTSNKIKFFAYIWGSVNGQFKKEWYQGTEQTNGTYKFTYKGSANSVIFCYMSPSTPSDTQCNIEEAKDSDDSTKVNIWNTYRWLQTYDLSFPLENGVYTYVVTSRRYPYANTSQVLGYWKHSYAKINVAKCSDSASQNSSNTVGMYLNDAYVDPNSAGNTTLYSTSNSIRAFDGKFDGKTYTKDGDGATLPYPYNATVTLTNSPGSAYNFDGWYTNAAGTGTKLTTAQLNSLTAANASDVNNGTTYYAKFVEKPETWQLQYGATSGSGTWNTPITLTRESSTSNYFKGSVTLTEGQRIYFKIYDAKHQTWYGNSGSYEEYTTTDILTNGTFNTSGGDATIRGHAGTYTFRWNYSTKQLTITAAYSNITITLDSSSTTWIADASAIVWFDTSQGSKQMTKVSSSKWTVSVPSNYSGNCQFKRNNSGNTSTWNTWNAGYRGFSTTYKTSGDGTGGWQ